jgi:hypothetical protein
MIAVTYSELLELESVGLVCRVIRPDGHEGWELTDDGYALLLTAADDLEEEDGDC